MFSDHIQSLILILKLTLPWKLPTQMQFPSVTAFTAVLVNANSLASTQAVLSRYKFLSTSWDSEAQQLPTHVLLASKYRLNQNTLCSS